MLSFLTAGKTREAASGSVDGISTAPALFFAMNNKSGQVFHLCVAEIAIQCQAVEFWI